MRQLTKHGLSRSREYAIWQKIKNRCLNPNDSAYADYGGRGIKICQRWMSFQNFYNDMGKRPSLRHSIDRYPNNNGNYEPGNCRWATQSQQMQNTRVSISVCYDGEIVNVTALAKRLGMASSTLDMRIRRGWSIKDATSVSTEKPKRRKNGQFERKVSK